MFEHGSRRATVHASGTITFLFLFTSAQAQVEMPRASPSTQDFATQSDFSNLAQYDRDFNISVAQRVHPEYEQVGARVGVFDVLPSIGLGLGHDSNVYSAPSNVEADTFALLSPDLHIGANFADAAAWLDTQAVLKRFFRTAAADESAWKVALGGRKEYSNFVSIDAEASAERRYEESDSVGTPQDASQPVAVTDPQAYARLSVTTGRLRNAMSVQAVHFDYGDVRTFTGSEIDESYRNETIYRIQQRSEFGLSPSIALFEAATFTLSNYESSLPLADKDSHEYRGLFGINFDLTNLLRGEIAAGYLERDFRSNTFQTLRGTAALLKLDYFPTPLTTVSIWGRRAIDDAAFLGVNAYFSNTANLQVDHELLRNLVISLTLVYQFDQYSATHGVDHSTSEVLHARYLMNRRVRLSFDINHTNRSTEGIDFAPHYSATSLLVNLTLAM